MSTAAGPPTAEPAGSGEERADAATGRLRSALVAELAKKTSVSWVRHEGGTHAIWHVWAEEALCVVSGGTEQPFPEVADGERVEVVMRSKDDGGRLLTWIGTASVVRPDEPAWQPTTAALVAARLNLPDVSAAADGWARTSTVRRIVPTGDFVEAPGSLSDDAHLGTPPSTPATTRGPLPRILHRRVRRRPELT